MRQEGNAIYCYQLHVPANTRQPDALDLRNT